jgi:hypothetical protein
LQTSRWSRNCNAVPPSADKFVEAELQVKDQRMSTFHRLGLAIAGLLLFLSPRAGADTLREDFSSDPLSQGWRLYGNTNLFLWNSTHGSLDVTWDSSQPNSYCYRPLATILAIDDDFSLAFDLQLNDAQATGFFELAVGLMHVADATNADFSRATANAPNLFEFDYYPDGGFGPSIDATMSDDTVNATNTANFYFAYDTVPLFAGTLYHVTLTHQAGEASLSGSVATNGSIYTSLPNTFPGPITDFRLDAVSVISYSAAGDSYGDSILAHGTVDNFVVTFPPPPIQDLTGAFSNGLWQARFLSRTNWLYTLQRSFDFATWTDASATTPGNGEQLTLSDEAAIAQRAFYRVRANRP